MFSSRAVQPSPQVESGIDLRSPPFRFAVLAILAVQLSVYLALPLGLVSVIWLMAKRPALVWPAVLWMLPLLMLIGLGVLGGFDQGRPWRDIARDVFYFSVFVGVLAYGFAARAAGLTFQHLIFAIVIGLSLRYAVSAVQLVSGIGAGYESVGELRDELGQTATGGATLVLPSLFLVPVGWRVAFLLVLIPNFLSLGRSNLITVGFLLLAKGVTWAKWAIALGLGLGVIYVAVQPGSNRLLDSFVDKVMFSTQEVGDKSFFGEEDIHRKWRAYERYIVGVNIASSDGYLQFLGEGFGSVVEAQINKRSDSSGLERSNLVPVFHDSSLFIRLKLGLLGLSVWTAWWAASVVFSVLALRQLCVSRGQFWGQCAALTISLALGAFFYGFPLMKNVGVETLMLGFLVGAYCLRERPGPATWAVPA